MYTSPRTGEGQYGKDSPASFAGNSTAERYARAYGIPSLLRSRGLGAPITGGAAQANQIAALGAGVTTSMLVAFGAIGGPIGAAIGGAIAVASAIASLFGGCGQTCVAATRIANQVSGYLDQNLANYMNSPVHYYSLQQAALNNVKTALDALNAGCSDPQLGDAGKRCISERTVRNGTAPWCPKPRHTGCDYWQTYYDPIANDPNVVPDPSPVSSAGSSVLSAIGINPSTQVFGMPLSSLLLPVGLIAVGLFAFSGERR